MEHLFINDDGERDPSLGKLRLQGTAAQWLDHCDAQIAEMFASMADEAADSLGDAITEMDLERIPLRLNQLCLAYHYYKFRLANVMESIDAEVDDGTPPAP